MLISKPARAIRQDFTLDKISNLHPTSGVNCKPGLVRLIGDLGNKLKKMFEFDNLTSSTEFEERLDVTKLDPYFNTSDTEDKRSFNKKFLA
jgi:hypothetical protein